MGIRGPKSTAELSVASIDVQAGRVRPPDDLPAPCAAIWRELVDSLPASRFVRSDVPLLALYVRTLHQATIAFAKLEQFGAAAGSELSPWLKVADVASRQSATLASRLRLCPQARLDRKTAGPQARAERGGALPWPSASEINEGNER